MLANLWLCSLCSWLRKTHCNFLFRPVLPQFDVNIVLVGGQKCWVNLLAAHKSRRGLSVLSPSMGCQTIEKWSTLKVNIYSEPYKSWVFSGSEVRHSVRHSFNSFSLLPVTPAPCPVTRDLSLAKMLKCSLSLCTEKLMKMQKCCCFPGIFPRSLSAAMPILINKKHGQLPVALCVLFRPCFVLFCF